MGKVTTPDAEEERIILENRMNPREYGVTYRTETEIYLLCYKTRDEIVIRKGDRPW